MSQHETRVLSASPEDIAQAARLLREGELVAFPTETVYGLGADATNGRAVAAIFAVKGRPHFNPLIVHVASTGIAQRYVIWNELADRLAAAFWPGPLTLVLPLRNDHGIAPLATAGLPTLAVRVPAPATARALLEAADRPVAAPSANPSGRISPTTAAHVLDGLGGRIAAVVDDGPCAVGIELTIIGFEPDPILLRPGGVSRDEIEPVLGRSLAAREHAAGVTAPGQLASHYAPAASVRLNAAERQPGELLLGFGPMDCDLNLSPAGDLVEAAANLFGHLHQLDARGQPIAVVPVPDVGIGQAINDRLRRAAAPRES